MTNKAPPRPSRRGVTAGIIATTTIAACGGNVPPPPPPPPLPPRPPPPGLFPLRKEAGKRHLVTASGAPYLMHGDAGWLLIGQLSREDVRFYLDDRQSRQFNTILVELIQHAFASNSPANIYNHQPFTTAGDFSTPNEAYFAHAEYVISQAQQRGLLLLLAPAYLGYGGGDEGWYATMAANGGDKLRNYGRYVANRFASYSNILWVAGGDYNPPDKSLSRAVAEGINDVLGTTLHTAHCGRHTSALDYWRGESWLTINNTYLSFGDVDASLAQYQQPEQMPYFMTEGRFENHPSCTPTILRAQAYATVLCGGFGHVYGNEDVWHFDGPGLFPRVRNWKTALASSGAQKMQIFFAFFSSLQWSQLAPDTAGEFLTAGQLSGESKAAAALASDGSFGLIYCPTQRTMTVNLARLAGPNVRARWFDPTNGAYTPASGPNLAGGQSRTFTPPATNSAGDADWVLVVESAQAQPTE